MRASRSTPARPAPPQNVADNFNIFRDPEQGQNAIFWATVTDVTAGEGNTVVVTLSKPFAAFPETLATEYSMIHNPAARAAAGDQFGATTADGTGPFTLTEFTPGNQVLLTRWDGLPRLERRVRPEQGAGLPRRDAVRADPRGWQPRQSRSRPATSTRSRTRRPGRRPPEGQPGPGRHGVGRTRPTSSSPSTTMKTELGLRRPARPPGDLARHRPRGHRPGRSTSATRSPPTARSPPTGSGTSRASSSSTSSTPNGPRRCSTRRAGRRARTASARRTASSSRWTNVNFGAQPFNRPDHRGHHREHAARSAWR